MVRKVELWDFRTEGELKLAHLTDGEAESREVKVVCPNTLQHQLLISSFWKSSAGKLL